MPLGALFMVIPRNVSHFSRLLRHALGYGGHIPPPPPPVGGKSLSSDGTLTSTLKNPMKRLWDTEQTTSFLLHIYVLFPKRKHHINSATNLFSCLVSRWRRVELNWLFNVTINDISVIYVTAHRCAGGLKKKKLLCLHNNFRSFLERY